MNSGNLITGRCWDFFVWDVYWIFVGCTSLISSLPKLGSLSCLWEQVRIKTLVQIKSQQYSFWISYSQIQYYLYIWCRWYKHNCVSKCLCVSSVLKKRNLWLTVLKGTMSIGFLVMGALVSTRETPLLKWVLTLSEKCPCSGKTSHSSRAWWPFLLASIEITVSVSDVSVFG